MSNSIGAERIEDFDDLFERLDQEATGGLSLKALFRRVRDKRKPEVEPTDEAASSLLLPSTTVRMLMKGSRSYRSRRLK